jgi:hypothetical protein
LFSFVSFFSAVDVVDGGGGTPLNFGQVLVSAEIFRFGLFGLPQILWLGIATG